MPLSGKVALVTGASSGIGRAICTALAAEGARLTLMSRREPPLQDLAGQIEQAGGQALVTVCDVTSEAEIIDCFAKSRDHWDGLDVVVNAAGIGLSTTISDGTADDWRRMLEVNVWGLAVATREAIRHFGDRGGHVINVSSMAGHRVPPMGGFYAATKFAVRALTEIVRLEMRRNNNPTRITAISPGLVETAFFDHYFRGQSDKVQEVLTRYDQILTPEDVAATVVHVLQSPPHVEIHDVLMRATEQET